MTRVLPQRDGPVESTVGTAGAGRVVFNWGYLSWLCTMLCCGWAGAAPAIEALPEYHLKAVLLFNLARFVEWPAEAFAGPDSPLIVGVVGRDPFGQALDEAFQGERVHGRPVVIERYRTTSALRQCHLLFISSSEEPNLPDVLQQTAKWPTLTVAELGEFVRSGGMVGLFIDARSKIRLRINLPATRAKGITPSAKLLRVAEVVKENGG